MLLGLVLPHWIAVEAAVSAEAMVFTPEPGTGTMNQMLVATLGVVQA
jgi:hypothetical protein